MEITTKQSKKNKFGQYFTPKVVAEFMIELATIQYDSKILEPSCGEGVFLEILKQNGFQNIMAYEIDTDLANQFDCVKYESFVTASINQKFDLIIGNPPYIRWKNLENELKKELSTHPIWNKYFNSLCDYLYIFILKSIELLNENGQLIFICPEYWMNTTHSLSLRNYMVQNGYFETIYHFNETPIFDKVTVSIIIFKFVKSKQKKEKIDVSKFYANQKLTIETLFNLKNKIACKDAEFLSVSQFQYNERWLLQSDEIRKELKILEKNCFKKNQNNVLNLFEDHKQQFHTIGDFCDIGNGLVSGLDKAFQVNGHALNENEQAATINVVKAKDLNPFVIDNMTKYIYINEGLEEENFKENYPNFYNHFQKYKSDLDKRYQYNRKINYWEWVFLRNFNLFKKNEKRIFVPCKERISNKNYFRFALVDESVFPTQDVTALFRKPITKESIEYILAYLNHPIIFDWLKCNGIVKGNIVEFSEKPISSIPFRVIDWANENEVALHDSISEQTKKYLKNQDKSYIESINESFNILFNLTQCT
ncbi:restriction endonuclease [Flavobacterium branchiophilum]|uniref:site-specific DNA-methyltransferase (adenine-specific) n=1 Tax=Flavobacterium branchiophilum TaxID=55197 RepID=A0A543G008_9FLAO|nr:N-6 DNA methylase [Flavobacterium branchiophilum]OXA74519.1 restriction endonuclease [Flavobacterium branchiophilum] [Flavobacterium branchiophilum NBRC 15030 = ATCC 35035]TQM39419.1 adenine-specific DNA-methyltransferase [Flavobacterium branchiophilum]GEM55491.1 putative modification methylase HindII [Flavobacterium branchiophilum NBRC 15030 = ATCC 35035]